MKDKRIISISVVLAIVASSIGASLWLVPNQEQMRERLFKDQISGEILSLIEAGTFGDKSNAHTLFAQMSAEQLAFVRQISRLSPRECLQHIFNPARSIHYDLFVHYFVIAAVQYVDVISPEAAFTFIAPKVAQIPQPMRSQLLRLLATNALATNNPETAVRILQASCVGHTSDWESVSSLVEVNRWTNRPKEAHAALKNWLSRHGKELAPQLQSKANELLFSLALEASVPEEALAAGLAELRRLPTDSLLPLALLEQTFQAGLYSGNTRDVLPWIERHLHGFAEDQMPWLTLLKRGHEGLAVSPDYLMWTKRAAQIADWNTVSPRACYHHLRLIAMGQLQSLDRYLPLAKYLGQGQEIAALLTALGPVPEHEELQLTLARLTASNGDADVALKLYTTWLTTHPDDHTARWEHACLTEALAANPAEAIAIFERFLKDYPDDSRALKRAVSLLNRNGHHAEAMQYLDALPDAKFDADTLEDYILLAESLDAAPSLLRALRIKIATALSPNVADYLRIAEIARTVENVDAALKVLLAAIEQLPHVSALRSQMASILLQEERYDEAVTAALHPAARDDREAKLIALSACIHTSRAGEVLQVLGEDFSRETLAYNTVLDLAVAHRQAGHLQRAAALFASVPETPMRYSRIAEAYLLAEDFTEAARLAQKNINGKSKPEAADWILLGDVHHKQGQTDEAQAAYARAIKAVTARLQGNTAAIELPSNHQPLTSPSL